MFHVHASTAHHPAKLAEWGARRCRSAHCMSESAGSGPCLLLLGLTLWWPPALLQFYCGYSGQSMVDDISAAAFNVLFTSVPILLFAVLDRPVHRISTLLRFPQARPPTGTLQDPVRRWLRGCNTR